MKIENYYQKMNAIYEHLQDAESRALFEARITYLLNKNEDDYEQTIRSLYHDWHSQKELEDKLSMNPKGIIIFGAGPCGKILKQRLRFFVGERYGKILFCDTYKAGEMVDGKRVLSVDEVVKEYRDYLVIVGTDHYSEEVYQQLIEKGFDDKNILSGKYSLSIGMRGNQYFDVFKPQKEEVFIDAGSFNGYTSLDFLKWAKGNCKKIYALEPLSDAYNAIQEMKIPKTEVLNCAAWNKKEKLHFMENNTASRVSSDGEVEVKGVDIDSIVEDKVTFIKMDIEGGELKALEGAKKTIIYYQPRLAISIYHKPMDIIEIAAYILELVPDYKFYIRHYCSNMNETILYAEI